MQKVKVRRGELLAVLRKNRDEHRTQFLKACEGFREEAIAQLDRMLADAKSGKQIRQYVGLDEPRDMTKEYDRVIKMLEMSVDSEIELTNDEAKCFVCDDWSWKQAVAASNLKYIKSL